MAVTGWWAELFAAPSSISSMEALGTAALTVGAVSISPTAIASVEEFGTANIPTPQELDPSAIASEEAFGTHTVAPAAVTVTATGIASAEAVGSATVNNATAVSYDATGATYQVVSTTSSKSWTHVLDASATGIVVYATTWNGNPIMGAKVGTTPMIPCGVSTAASSTNTLTLHAFVLKNPPTGSQTISLTLSVDGQQAAAASMSYINVGDFGDAITNYAAGTSSNTSGTITSNARQMVTNAFTCANTGSGAYSSYSQTSRKSYNATGQSEPFIAGDAPGASTVTFSATGPASGIFLSASIPILADALTGVPVIDSVGAGFQANSSTPSWTHVLTGSATAIIVPVSIWVNANPPTISASIGSTKLVMLGSSTNIYNTAGVYLHQYLFGMMNPPTGSQTISITSSGGSNYQTSAQSLAYQNVKAFGTFTKATSSGTSASMNVASAPGQRVVQAFTCANVGSGSIVNYNGTARFAVDANGGTEPHIIGDATGAATVNFSATTTGSAWGGIAIPVLTTDPGEGAQRQIVIANSNVGPQALRQAIKRHNNH